MAWYDLGTSTTLEANKSLRRNEETKCIGTSHVHLVHRAAIAKGTMAFSFAKLAGIAFQAGQSLEVIVVESPPTDAAGHTRTFAIARAPQDDMRLVATRIRDTACTCV